MRITFLSSISAEYATMIGRVLPLARVLRKEGHEVQVLALHHNWAGRPEEVLYRDLPVHYVSAMHVRGLGDARRQVGGAELLGVAMAATWRLLRAALSVPTDLYHVWKAHPFNGLAGVLASRLRRRPLFVDCDDYETASTRFTGRWQQGVVRWFEDNIPRAAAGVTVNTRFWQERLVGTLGAPASRVAYIPNGVEMERFAHVDAEAGRRLRAHFGLEDKLTVVYVGILSLTCHPLDLLTAAFEQLAWALPAAHLVLVGGGEDGHSLRRWAAQAGLEGRVTFTGVVPADEIGAYYLLGDCSVDPVRDDASGRSRCPMKIVESMACGVPVVTGDVGDRRELLGDGRAGLLVRPGDATALAEGIQALLTDPGRRAQLSGQAHREVQRYSWAQLGQEVADFYRRVLSG